VAYTYGSGRGAEHARALLEDFSGTLQTDGYAAYKTLTKHNRQVTLAHCWSHLRRKLFDIEKAGSAPIAREGLQRIAQLYAIEADIRGQSAEARQAERQARSAPLIAEMKPWLETCLNKLSGRSKLAEAIRYALGHWQGLCVFLEDGRIELDTNPVERAMRPIALGRKNSLFAGSDEGAEHWAIIATLIENCKLHDVNPAAYLTDVITRLINGHLESRLNELTPWAWAKLHRSG
jgi:hypothetical protein